MMSFVGETEMEEILRGEVAGVHDLYESARDPAMKIVKKIKIVKVLII